MKIKRLAMQASCTSFGSTFSSILVQSMEMEGNAVESCQKSVIGDELGL